MVEGNGQRVALVHDWLTGMRGGEKVLETVAEFFPEAPIYTLFHFPGSVSEALESHPIVTSHLQRAPGLRKHYRSYLPLFPAAIESFDLTGFDFIFSISHCVAKGVIPGPNARHVCYCNTPVRYAWDQEHAYFPRRTGAVARVRSLLLSGLRRWDVASSPRVDHFVANSSFIARRIERYYGRQASVVHPPVDVEYYTPDDRQRERFALVVNAPAPYKRIDLAIEACREADVELTIVGGGDMDRLRPLAGPKTRFLGRVPAEQLRDLYRSAACLLQPGVEDFGMAVVEALACGCPVVALGKGGVLDIVEHGKHGVLYQGEGESKKLQKAIDKFWELRSNFMDLRARAEEFSAARFRRQLQELIENTQFGEAARQL